MKSKAEKLNNLFNALDRVPAEKRAAVIQFAGEYLQTIGAMRDAGASQTEIEAAADTIAAKYL
jgi:hypothetical protein